MTLKGGTSQACAACKFRRRKCNAECPLAPYFPADQPKTFQSAHRLFGVSNMLKILKELDPVQHMEAMRSIIYQATIRNRFPVDGCSGFIEQLKFQIHHAEEELYAVLAQLAFCRQHHQHDQIPQANPNDYTSHLQLGMGQPSNALSLFHQDAPQSLPIASHHFYPNSTNVGYNSGYLDKDNNAVNPFWVQHPYGSNNNNNNNNNNTNNNPMAMQSHQLVASPQLTIQQEPAQEYDEMHPFFDTIDDRQSYIDSKEAYDSSSDSSLKDTTQSIENVADNELKSAAACFSLTSVN